MTSLVLLGSAFLVAPQGVAAAAAWSPAGDLTLARLSHEATLLADGRVLVTGGNTAVGNTYDTKTAEVYDPGTNSWSTTGSTANGRAGHTATRLGSGKVLVTGGVNANVCTFDTTAELYDSSTGTWSFTGSLAAARYFGTATLLNDGKVLAAGGGNRCGAVFSSAEIYDPVAGTWSGTGFMTTGREFFDAVRLGDGRVLAVGGAGPAPTFAALSSAEIFDPATGTWSATGSMVTTRVHPILAVLADGRVMATGGYSGAGNAIVANGPAVEIFDPATGTWSATGSLSIGRSGGSLSLLGTGMVLAAGGTDGVTTHSSAELWDPATGTWAATAALTNARNSHTATVLANGRVLVAAGYDGSSCCLTSAELYTPFTYDFSGFFAPVNNPPTFNAVRAGSAIPVKFSLNGDQGLDIFASGYPRSRVIACDTSVPIDGIEETVTAGASGLSYDAALDEYTYIWKTSKAWKGTCRQLQVMLNDGSLHTANFQFG